MTWKEFKKYIDKELESHNISEDQEIFYIDFPCDYVVDEPNVNMNDDGRITIS
jgi:hypothetical protein